MIPKHAQVMGNRIRSICHYKVMPFQPVSLQVTDVNDFLRKKNRFSIRCKNAKVSKREAWKFSVPETLCVCVCVCVCVCRGGGLIMHYLCCQCVLKHAYESVRMTNRAV